ncbi:MAG: hypothetical protein J7K96_05485 [Desulfobacteraceae bacterium]|nr:hypothetical protein [Desulfobacteraceae bacterium]
MNIAVKFTFFLSLCLMIIHAGSSAAESPAFSYPDSLLVKLGIDAQNIIKNQEKFRSDPIHTQWMAHVHETMPDIDPDKKETIIKTHTLLLLIKNKLDKNYFSGKINKQEYTTQLTGAMKWFQEANHSFLSIEEYNALFGISGREGETSSAHASDDKIGFPINNPKTTVEMIKRKIDASTIKGINRFYHVQSQDFRDMKTVYETEGFQGEDAKQIKVEMRMAEKELQAVFIAHCRSILTVEQFKLIFGSPTNE